MRNMDIKASLNQTHAQKLESSLQVIHHNEIVKSNLKANIFEGSY
jgi:hypothetical protein